MERRDRQEERRREAIQSVARDVRNQAQKSGKTLSTSATEERVRRATLREDARNPRS